MHFEINAIPACKWCSKAKEAVSNLEGSTHAYVVRDKSWFRNRGFTTAPQIFVREGSNFSLYKHIGGYDDLVAYLKSL